MVSHHEVKMITSSTKIYHIMEWRFSAVKPLGLLQEIFISLGRLKWMKLLLTHRLAGLNKEETTHLQGLSHFSEPGKPKVCWWYKAWFWGLHSHGFTGMSGVTGSPTPQPIPLLSTPPPSRVYSRSTRTYGNCETSILLPKSYRTHQWF